MKKIFVKISRVLAILAIVAIAILVYYVVTTTGDEIDLPSGIGLFVFGALILFAVALSIAVILDIVESYKREGFSFLKKYILEIVLIGVIFTLYEYFISKSGETWIDCFIQAAIFTCVIRAGSNVILAKGE